MNNKTEPGTHRDIMMSLLMFNKCQARGSIVMSKIPERLKHGEPKGWIVYFDFLICFTLSCYTLLLGKRYGYIIQPSTHSAEKCPPHPAPLATLSHSQVHVCIK